MTRLMIRAAAFALASTLALTTAAQTAEPAPLATPAAAKEMVIYDKALGDGWQNWSWAKTELSIEITGSARKPIRVEAGPWEALYLQHAAFSTSGFKLLALLIQGSAPDGQVRIHGLIDGKVASEGYPVKVGNTGWTQVKVPLATLGIEDKMTDGIWVQNATGAALPKFYVTDIKLE